MFTRASILLRAVSHTSDSLLCGGIAGRTTDDLLICRLLRRRAQKFLNIEIIGQSMKNILVQGHPRLCVHLRIVNLYAKFHSVVVHSMERLFDTQLIAVRPAYSIDPR